MFVLEGLPVRIWKLNTFNIVSKVRFYYRIFIYCVTLISCLKSYRKQQKTNESYTEILAMKHTENAPTDFSEICELPYSLTRYFRITMDCLVWVEKY